MDFLSGIIGFGIIFYQIAGFKYRENKRKWLPLFLLAMLFIVIIPLLLHKFYYKTL